MLNLRSSASPSKPQQIENSTNSSWDISAVVVALVIAAIAGNQDINMLIAGLRRLDRHIRRRVLMITALALLSIVGYWGVRYLTVASWGDPSSTAVETSKQRELHPGFACSNPVWNLGDIEPAQQYEHVFHFSNEGSSAVEIVSVKTSCGCTIIRPHETRILSKHSVDIPVVLSPGVTVGPFRRNVFVAIDAPGGKQLDLEIRGAVRPSPYLFSSSPIVDLGKLQKGSARVWRVSVARYNKAPVVFDQIRSSSSAISLEEQPTASAVLPGGLDVLVAFDASNLAVGPFSASMSICAHGEANESVVKIAVKAEIVDDTGFVSSVYLGKIKIGESRTISLIDSHTAVAPVIDTLTYSGDCALSLQKVTDVRPELVCFKCVERAETARAVRGVLSLSFESRETIEVPVFAILTPEE